MNSLHTGEISRKSLAAGFSSAMSMNLDALLLLRRLAGLGQEDLFRFVEQKQLAPIFLTQLLCAPPEDAPPQQLNLFEMLQRFVLILNLFRVFSLQFGCQLTDQILQFFNTTWTLSQFFLHPRTLP